MGKRKYRSRGMSRVTTTTSHSTRYVGSYSAWKMQLYQLEAELCVRSYMQVSSSLVPQLASADPAGRGMRRAKMGSDSKRTPVIQF